MTSTLKVTEIKDKDTDERVDTVKMWCTFDGDASGDVSIRDSLNISSVNDTNTGVYQVTMTNPMTNTTWCKGALAQRNSAEVSSAVGVSALKGGTISTTRHDIFTYSLNTFAANDPENTYVFGIGVLA